jgi:flavodoxin
MKSLIVYSSQTDNTKKLADHALGHPDKDDLASLKQIIIKL